MVAMNLLVGCIREISIDMVACKCVRWGEDEADVVESVVANYSAAGLPLEVLWSDIDYQNNRFKTMDFDPGACVCATLEVVGSWVPLLADSQP